MAADGRSPLQRYLKELEARARGRTPGYRRSDVLTTVNQSLTARRDGIWLSRSTVSDWFTLGRVSAEFGPLWSFVEQLLKQTGDRHGRTPPNNDSWWTTERARCRGIWEAARETTLGLPRIPDKASPDNLLLSAITRQKDENAGTSKAVSPVDGLPKPSFVVRKSVDEWNPIDLGVHPAIRGDLDATLGTAGKLPAYIRREHDERIGALISEIVLPVMLVLVGKSSTGKTRSAFEVVKRAYPDFPLINPVGAGALFQTLENLSADPAVIWLDEAQEYLLYTQGERNAEAIWTLLVNGASRVAIVESIWPRYWETLTSRASDGQPDKYFYTRKLLALSNAYRVDIPDDFSRLTSLERQNLDRLANHDHRLQIALKVAGRGKKITRVLAGGVLLLDRYEHASDPSSKAIITAAMDARRVGYDKPLPVELLKDAVPGYLTDEQRVGTHGWFADAIARAAEPVHGISAMTPCRTDPGAGEANAYILHDYLFQYALTPGHTVANPTFIRNVIIAQLLREAESGDYSVTIKLADEMYMAGRVEESIPWLERAIASEQLENEELEYIDCMERLARALDDVGRREEALEWYERLRTEGYVYQTANMRAC